MVPNCKSDLISKNWRVLNTYIIVSSEMPGNTTGSHVLVVKDPAQNKLKEVSGKMQQQPSNNFLACTWRWWADVALHFPPRHASIKLTTNAWTTINNSGALHILVFIFQRCSVWDLGLAKKRSSFFVVCKLKEVSQSMVPLVNSRKLTQADTVREVFGVDELGEQLN